MCARSAKSLYVHVPFCRSRCDYCSFYSLSGNLSDSRFADYLALVSEQLIYQKKLLSLNSLDTLYIGGGTPSGLGLNKLEQLLELLHAESFMPKEYTVECNPEDISAELLALLERYGVNRLSVGIQSFDPQLLKNIGRRTDPADNKKALNLISKYWKHRLSLDFMIALPGQTQEGLLKDLQAGLSWHPDHLSVYELDIEEGTPLCQRQGQLVPASDRQRQSLYRTTVRFLKEQGFLHYEVSNFCKPGFQSRHNCAYWRLYPYAGVGPGAVMMSGFDEEKAIRKTVRFQPSETAQSAFQRWLQDEETISRFDYLFEILMMGLRTSFGVFLPRVRKLGGPNTTEEILKCLDAFGAIYRIKKNRLILTEKGIEMLNPILLALLEWKDQRLGAGLT